MKNIDIMASYYVQNFSYDGPGESKCYAEMNAHDHDQSTQFSVDVTAYLTGMGLKNIRPGKFLSNQPAPAQGKEFRWDGSRWVKS